MPTVGDLGVEENPLAHQKRQVVGGETVALQQMAQRLKVEREAFLKGSCRPLQARPDLLGPPLSMSAAIALGAISVRLYEDILNIFRKIV